MPRESVCSIRYGLASAGAEKVQGTQQTSASDGERSVLVESCFTETVVDVVGAILGVGVRRTQRQKILVTVRPLQLRIAALPKLTRYRQQYADNQNISFLPGIMTTSSRIHGEFLRLLFLQAHRETTAHFQVCV